MTGSDRARRNGAQFVETPNPFMGNPSQSDENRWEGGPIGRCLSVASTEQ